VYGAADDSERESLRPPHTSRQRATRKDRDQRSVRARATFIETARELGADRDGGGDELMRKLRSMPHEPHGKNRKPKK
jgi:hypothetical protein